mmetsp:Transcript_32374/g.78973  ORF Transcript_32374/g.78973 Transcript_32374/m.78973 type:complete len:526 (+) Transcript_32374:133-1710(+)
MMKEMDFKDVEDINRGHRRTTMPAASSSRTAPRTNSSDRLYKGMVLIVVAFCVVLIIVSTSHTTIVNVSSSSSLNGGRGGRGSSKKIEMLRDFKQQQQPPKPKPKSIQQQDHPPYHMVFSTSCNDQQHWESYVFFYHTNKVGQPGTVTRICSGCSDKEARALQDFHDRHIKTMNPSFFLHLTPDFGQLMKKQKLGAQTAYKYMNKPYGLKHWMDNILKMNETTSATSSSVEDGIVFLLDPDMILFRPLVHDFTNEDVMWVTHKDQQQPRTKIVKHGYPIAQQDGYLTNQWMGLNASFITDGGNINNIPSKDGPIHWNTGPPYIATVKDMYQIASLWCDYAPRVYHIHPKLFAEMFGYIYATTQLDLPHTLIKSIVISNTETNREGWPYIDNLAETDICDTPSDSALPVGLHYCKRYMLEKWFFSKYRLKKKYISCESPLLEPPPTDLATRNHSVAYAPPPHGHNVKEQPWESEAKQIKPWRAKREAFMLCHLITKINEAAKFWKEQNCGDNGNYEYYNLHDDPNH